MNSVALSLTLLSAACTSQGNHLRPDDMRRVDAAAAARAADNADAQIRVLERQIIEQESRMNALIEQGGDFSSVEAEVVRLHDERARLMRVQNHFFDGLVEDLDITNAQLKAAEQADNKEEALQHFGATRSMVSKLRSDLRDAERVGNKQLADQLRPLVDLLDREANLELSQN